MQTFFVVIPTHIMVRFSGEDGAKLRGTAETWSALRAVKEAETSDTSSLLEVYTATWS